MANLFIRDKRNGIWWIRLQVPADLQERWGKRNEVRSLRTTDKFRATSLAGPIQEQFKAQVAAMRAAMAPAAATPVVPFKPLTKAIWTPDEADAVIQRWNKATVDQAYLDHFHGTAPTYSRFGEEAGATSERIYALSQRRWADVAGFDDALIATLEREGLKLDPASPALVHLRSTFGTAWESAERHIDRFRNGDFSRWAIEPTAAPLRPAESLLQRSGSPAAGMALTKLVERFLTGSAKPPAKSQADDIRHAVRRLVEFHGDLPPSAIDAKMADDFARAIADFPVTRRMDILNKPIRVILSDHATVSGAKLSTNSRRKWLANLSRVFAYAQSLGEAEANPFADLAPDKPKRHEMVKQRRAYTPEEIHLMFNAPLFQGFAGKIDQGYRNEHGDQVVRDAKYWLPIFALLHGCRLEEIAAARMDELAVENGIAHFDWTTTPRPFKTEESRRKLPLHPALIALGWEQHVTALRKAKSFHLFPELPHDPANEEKCSKLYSKWFGRWRHEIGIADPMVDFHAFRHTFKRAARGVMSEELHDLLTGHKGAASVGRTYGQGADVKVLADALAKVKYPTFPKLP